MRAEGCFFAFYQQQDIGRRFGHNIFVTSVVVIGFVLWCSS